MVFHGIAAHWNLLFYMYVYHRQSIAYRVRVMEGDERWRYRQSLTIDANDLVMVHHNIKKSSHFKRRERGGQRGKNACTHARVCVFVSSKSIRMLEMYVCKYTLHIDYVHLYAYCICTYIIHTHIVRLWTMTYWHFASSILRLIKCDFIKILHRTRSFDVCVCMYSIYAKWIQSTACTQRTLHRLVPFIYIQPSSFLVSPFHFSSVVFFVW